MSTEPPPDPDRSPGRAFGADAEAYDRGRPGYPDEALEWLVGPRPCSVLELGAGTGRLTGSLLAAGHDVLATDPDPRMLAVLERRHPDARTTLAAAEDPVVPDRSVDVVVCGQSFHWFDPARALPAIARALRPHGHLAVVWNQRDERIPWVRRLGRLLGSPQPGDALDPLIASPLFSFVEEAAYSSWQSVDRDRLEDLVRSRSRIATAPEATRERVLAEARALYDGYGRGHDGMQLPYVVHCRRSRVVHQPGLFDGGPDGPDGAVSAETPGVRDRDDRPADDPDTPDAAGGASSGGAVSDGSDSDVLLIDFR